MAVFQIPGGIIGSRIGNREVASIGMLVLGVSGILSGLSPGFGFLIATRFLGALGRPLLFSCRGFTEVGHN